MDFTREELRDLTEALGCHMADLDDKLDKSVPGWDDYSADDRKRMRATMRRNRVLADRLMAKLDGR